MDAIFIDNDTLRNIRNVFTELTETTRRWQRDVGDDREVTVADEANFRAAKVFTDAVVDAIDRSQTHGIS